MPTLVIGNKLYSSWSMRPWLLLRQLGIRFDEVLIPLDQPDTKQKIREHSPAGKVPILIEGDIAVWESIAIMDHVGETYEDAEVWPRDPHARAMARSVAAEMHAGFTGIRSACPMNLGKKFAERDRGPAVARDVARITEMLSVDRPVIFDCVVDKNENCFPMIPSGKAHNEMLLNDYLGETGVDIGSAISEEGKVLV